MSTSPKPHRDYPEIPDEDDEPYDRCPGCGVAIVAVVCLSVWTLAALGILAIGWFL